MGILGQKIPAYCRFYQSGDESTGKLKVSPSSSASSSSQWSGTTTAILLTPNQTACPSHAPTSHEWDHRIPKLFWLWRVQSLTARGQPTVLQQGTIALDSVVLALIPTTSNMAAKLPQCQQCNRDANLRFPEMETLLRTTAGWHPVHESNKQDRDTGHTWHHCAERQRHRAAES